MTTRGCVRAPQAKCLVYGLLSIAPLPAVGRCLAAVCEAAGMALVLHVAPTNPVNPPHEMVALLWRTWYDPLPVPDGSDKLTWSNSRNSLVSLLTVILKESRPL